MKEAMGRLLLACLLLVATAWAPQAAAYIRPVEGVTHFEDTIAWGGRNRHALFFRPAVAKTTRVPLLVMLHYRGGNAEDMAALTQVSLLVRDTGIWVVLPEAVRGEWNGNPAEDSGVDDVGYLARVIDSAVSRFPVNKNRVYMAGYSNGGFMAIRFTCTYPYRVAAVATVAAAFSKAMSNACHPAVGTPMLMINGTQDTRVEYDASSLGMLTVPATAARWAQMAGCPTAARRSRMPDLVNDRTTVSLDTWASCVAGEVGLYTVDHGGHTWPDSHDNCVLCGRTTFDIDGTLAIWSFVRRFVRS